MRIDGIECQNINCEWHHKKASYGCKRCYVRDDVVQCWKYTHIMPKKLRTPEHEAVVKTLKEMSAFVWIERTRMKGSIKLKDWEAAACYDRRVRWTLQFLKLLALNWRNRNKKGAEIGRTP